MRRYEGVSEFNALDVGAKQKHRFASEAQLNR